MDYLRKLSLLSVLTGTVLASRVIPPTVAAHLFYADQGLHPFSKQELNMAATLSANSTTNSLLTAEAIAKIDAYLDAVYTQGRFSGNVIIAQGKATVMTRSYGLANREHEVLNSRVTKFRIGSVTKQFTAVAILQLREQGLLDLQAPISTYLPDYPKGEQITVHHLLTHTAGIPEYLDAEIFPDLAEWMRLPSSLDQLVDRFKDLPLEFGPGEKFKYSNSGYVLLTQIVETVSQQPYADYLQTNIFNPLGLENTGYEIPQTVIPRLAQGYTFIGQDTYLQASPFDMSIPQGAGGLYSTVQDLNIWNQWLHGDEVGTVLSEVARSALMTPAVQMEPDENPDAFYGYGLVIDGHLGRQRIGHDGGISGFASSLAYYPEATLMIAVLSNLESRLPTKIVQDLAAIAFGEPYEIPQQPTVIEIDPAIYEQYVGTYQLLPEMQVTIRVEAGALTAQATGQDTFVLYPSSETDFFAEVADITVSFALAGNGAVEGLTLYQLGQELFAPKIDP
ncbi:MAG: serine hydrolase [Phormidesmis sp.]